MPAINIQLYQQQLDFVTADDHHLAFVAGIGSGKSVAGAMRALLASQGAIGSRRIAAPNVGLVTAPTYPMLRDATIRTFRQIADPWIRSFNRSEATAVLKNGSEVFFRSTSEPENMRATNAAWWWGDEAAFYSSDVWKIGLGRLRQHGERGSAWLTTSPKGRNWLYKVFVQGEKRVIRAATWQNPFLEAGFVADLLREYTGDFARQEIEGDFVAHQGLIYPEYDRDLHVTYTQPTAPKTIIAGVDWGYSNPGVILVGMVDGDGRVHIVHEAYARRRRIEDWVSVAVQLRDTWGVRLFVCDPSEPDYIASFTDAGLIAQRADNRVNSGIQAVKARLIRRGDGRARLTIHPEAANLLTEFEQYQWAKGRDGLKDEPLKANDHAMDALRYLVMAVDADATTTTETDVLHWAG